ncbi:tigger transposable element-derived protein 4 [Bombyx mori]|uniref:HTH CENPB-type domain-containing protein n=1 Tax=Bombyx mori TaxID=7091 RepID=A0A8R2AUR8_BOMMO|nr:tigger transposable element-derived protein 4 [Bombyx mori]
MAFRTKRKAFSFHDKLKILQYYDKKSQDYKKSQIAAELEIPVSTLSTIVKYRADVENRCKNISGAYLKRKKNKSGKYVEIENVLIDWIVSMNAQNIPLDGPMMKQRALEIAKELEVYDFTASSGWYSRFKQRHAFSLNNDFDSDDGSDLTYESYQELVKDYEPCDVFNADEFGLFYKLMPNDMSTIVDKICKDGTMPEERFTVLACSNSIGSEKLPLLIIGNTENSDKDLPCQYQVNPKSWMTKLAFTNWLYILDEYFEIQGRLVVLFVDESPVHPKDIILNNINLVIIPPEAEHEMPMSQGIIKVIKQNYRIKLIEKYKEGLAVDFKQCLKYLTDVFESIKAHTIQSYFKKSGFGDYYEVDDEDDEYKEQILMKYQDYLYVDYELATCEVEKGVNQESTFTDNNIKEKVNKIIINNGETIDNKSVTALQAVTTLKHYLKSLDSENGLNNLSVIESIILSSISKNNSM